MTKYELFKQHISLVHRVYNDKFAHITSNEHIKEDIIQEGMLALWKACQNYDNSKGARFMTYAWQSIYNTMLCYASRYYKKTLFSVSIETPIKEDGQGNIATYDDILATPNRDIENYEIREIIEQVLSKMGNTARIVYNYTKDGYTQREVADMLHINQSQIARILKKFKTSLKVLYF